MRQVVSRTTTVFGGNVASMALGFISNILVLRALGPVGSGVVIIAMTVLNVFWQLTGRGIDQALVRCFAKYKQHDPARAELVLPTVHQIKLVLGGVVGLLGLAIAPVLTRLLFGPDASSAPLVIAALSSLAASIWGYTGACLQASSAFGKYNVVLLVNAAMRFIIVALLSVTGWMTPSWAIASMGIAYAVASIVGYGLCARAARSLRGEPDLRPIVYSSSRWLVISSVLYLLYSRLDQLMLSHMAGSGPTGVYGAAATFIQFVDLLTASLLTVLLPKTCTETDAASLRRNAWTSVRISVLLVIPMTAGFFVADPIMGRLLGASFGEASLLFKVILVGALFNVVTHPLQVVMHARGRTHVLLMLDIALLLISATGNYIAIRSYGVIGVAVTASSLRILGGAILALLVVMELRNHHRGSLDCRTQ